jgi:hypothetical protein
LILFFFSCAIQFVGQKILFHCGMQQLVQQSVVHL